MKLFIIAAGYGSRLKKITGDKPKQSIIINGKILIEHYLDIARLLKLEPIVITKNLFVPFFERYDLNIYEHNDSKQFLDSILFCKRLVTEDFCVISGDLYFANLIELESFKNFHIKNKSISTFMYVKSGEFKAKLKFENSRPHIVVTRVGKHDYSIPNFSIFSPDIFKYLFYPLKEFANRAINKNEKVRFFQYNSFVKEIDTVKDYNSLLLKLKK